MAADIFSYIFDTTTPPSPKVPTRFIPSSFDAHDPALQALPRPLTPSWGSGELLLRHFDSQGLMMRTPIFWQWGMSLHAACRALGIPIFVNEPENVPVGAMALKRSGVDTVVTENKDAAAFASYCMEKSLPLPKAWVLVHRAQNPDWRVAAGVATSRVAQEVHIFPGVPILVQCPFLAESQATRFHFSKEFLWEMRGDEVYATARKDDPLPLKNVRIPLMLQQAEHCACGAQTVTRI